MRSKMEMIREYLKYDHTEEIISKDKIDYINKY